MGPMAVGPHNFPTHPQQAAPSQASSPNPITAHHLLSMFLFIYLLFSLYSQIHLTKHPTHTNSPKQMLQIHIKRVGRKEKCTLSSKMRYELDDPWSLTPHRKAFEITCKLVIPKCWDPSSIQNLALLQLPIIQWISISNLPSSQIKHSWQEFYESLATGIPIRDSCKQTVSQSLQIKYGIQKLGTVAEMVSLKSETRRTSTKHLFSSLYRRPYPR